MATLAFKLPGEAIILIGETRGHLGQSVYLRDICGQEAGPPPPVDLKAEKINGDTVRALIGKGMVSAVHDCSDGGLAVAVAEMAMASGIGASVTLPSGAAFEIGFGEDQARYVVTCPAARADAVLAVARAMGAPAQKLGLTGGDSLTFETQDTISLGTISVAALRSAHEGWLPRYMAGEL
jgi:phosphoribosylformylglycinamidine synthase subunit PurL